MPPLVSTASLATLLGDPSVAILDCTYLDPALGRDARAEHLAARLPGARFLDMAALSDPDDPRPTMLADGARVAAALGALGVADGTHLVLYDDSPWHSAARAWWVLAGFGYPASILDGGLAKWRAEGRPMTSGSDPVTPTTPAPPAARHRVRDLAAVRTNIDTCAEQLVDTRSAARFDGTVADPRPGVAAGHVPNSVNLPYTRLFVPDGTWLPMADLARVLADAGVDPDRPVTATCGSGVTAATLVFALRLLGRDAALYDGSWSEWGADPSTPKAAA